MIDVFGEILTRIAGFAFSKAIDVAVGSREGDPDEEGVAVSPNHLAERRYAYRRWAERRGFVRDERWSDLFRGERSGRRLRFYTGVAGTRPRPPEIFIEHPIAGIESTIILTLDKAAPAGVDPAIRTVLGHDGVLQIEIDRKGIRLLFVPMVPADLLDPPLEDLLRRLAPCTTNAYR